MAIILASGLVLNDGMAASEYRSACAAARRQAYALMGPVRERLRTIYLKAAEDAAVVVKTTLKRGYSSLTAAAWESVASRLIDAAESISSATEAEALLAIRKAAALSSNPDYELMSRSTSAAGVQGYVTSAGLRKVASGIASDVVESMVSRVWQDGYRFSERVWGEGKDRYGYYLSPGLNWQDAIKMTIATGVAQGRDTADIAQDIKAYTRGGKPALVKRWGDLKAGTAEFARRLPKDLDWRALRLVRSEIGASRQAAAVLAGERNPAGTGKYRWVLSAAHMETGCECATLAAGGPYTKDQLPGYPHPNCMCSVEPELMDLKQFMSDLTAWEPGKSGYLEDWYRDVYLPAQEAA